MRRIIGTSGLILFIVAATAACGTDDAAGGSLDSIPASPTTPTSAPLTLRTETVPGTRESSPPDTSNPRATIASGSASDTAPPTLELDGVPPASIPMVISEHLNSVQRAVRAEVSDAVFAGSAFADAANVTMIIYGTDAAAVTAALDRADTPLRGRITVVETHYSLNDIETYAEQAQSRLDAAHIEASVAVQFGLDAVAVRLETPDGQPDESVEAEATNLLSDIPVVITFSGPLVPL